MEGLTTYCHKIGEMRHEIKVLNEAVTTLDKAFAQEAERLHRHDQACCLDELRARVTQETLYEQLMESAASCGFTEGRLIGGLLKFAGGVAIAAARQSKEHPLSVGAKLARDEFARTKPFGTVAVAVGPGGVPDDVQTMSISKLARDQSLPESAIRTALEAKGYRLMTPESFFNTLDKLKDSVLKGTQSLPAMKPVSVLSQASPSSHAGANE